MTQMEVNNKMFQEVFALIPESYRERYGIRLMTAGGGWKFPTNYLQIEGAKATILNDDKQLSIEESEECLALKIEGSAKITMYKNFTCIYTHL